MEEYGIELFERLSNGKFGDSILSSGHSEQWRSSAFDGEAAYNGAGAEKSVRARIKGVHGIGDPSHEIAHDWAHAYDLSNGDVKAELQYIPDTVHTTMKAVYSHYSQSPQRARRLERKAGSWGAANLLKKMHYVFEVRFVESEFKVKCQMLLH